MQVGVVITAVGGRLSAGSTIVTGGNVRSEVRPYSSLTVSVGVNVPADV